MRWRNGVMAKLLREGQWDAANSKPILRQKELYRENQTGADQTGRWTTCAGPITNPYYQRLIEDYRVSGLVYAREGVLLAG
jgi:hypothetical protein